MSEIRTVQATRRRAVGLAGLFAGVALVVTAKAATAPAPRPAALSGPRPSSSGPPTSGPAPAGPPTGTDRSVAGQVEDTPYGPVQVRVTVRGRRIVEVTALQMPSDASLSQEITGYAGPLLRQEVLSAQSASIDAVSGASYTSDGYARSVQSALDAMGR